MKEIWKDIEEYNGLYQVSNFGRIKNKKKEKILKLFLDTHGYVQVRLYKVSKNKSHKVHRLVAKAFLPNPNNLPCINHKDENRTNNKIDNLEWCTYKYNNNYGNRIEKYIEKRSKKTLQYDLKGNFIKEWESVKHITKELKISKSGISSCAKGKFKQFKGYIWKYKEGE